MTWESVPKPITREQALQHLSFHSDESGVGRSLWERLNSLESVTEIPVVKQHNAKIPSGCIELSTANGKVTIFFSEINRNNALVCMFDRTDRRADFDGIGILGNRRDYIALEKTGGAEEPSISVIMGLVHGMDSEVRLAMMAIIENGNFSLTQ